MIGEVIGAVIGKDLDENDGTAGALMGIAAAVIFKRLIPLAVLGAGILVAKHYLKGIDQPG